MPTREATTMAPLQIFPQKDQPDSDLTKVRNQDAYVVLGGIRIEARKTAWTWLKFTSNEEAAEISEFFATRIKPTSERTLEQSLENVQISVRWIEGIRSEPKLPQTVHELLHKP